MVGNGFNGNKIIKNVHFVPILNRYGPNVVLHTKSLCQFTGIMDYQLLTNI